MRKQSTRKELSPTIAALISSVLTAVATVLVAFIGIVPQLRAGDAKKADGLQGEVAKLTQMVGGLTISAQEGRTGTPPNQGGETQAPHVQFRWAAIDAPTGDQYVSKAKQVLVRGGFTAIGTNGEVVYGFNRDYTGLVWHLSPDAAIFIVAGPNWQIADKAAANLMSGF